METKVTTMVNILAKSLLPPRGEMNERLVVLSYNPDPGLRFSPSPPEDRRNGVVVVINN